MLSGRGTVHSIHVLRLWFDARCLHLHGVVREARVPVEQLLLSRGVSLDIPPSGSHYPSRDPTPTAGSSASRNPSQGRRGTLR